MKRANIRVTDILAMLAEDVSHEEVLRDFPDLEPNDINAPLAKPATRSCNRCEISSLMRNSRLRWIASQRNQARLYSMWARRQPVIKRQKLLNHNQVGVIAMVCCCDLMITSSADRRGVGFASGPKPSRSTSCGKPSRPTMEASRGRSSGSSMG
jgi:Protein of unknown function (DUF433)